MVKGKELTALVLKGRGDVSLRPERMSSLSERVKKAVIPGRIVKAAKCPRGGSEHGLWPQEGRSPDSAANSELGGLGPCSCDSLKSARLRGRRELMIQ